MHVRKASQSGYSLVEMLVVIAIIGILSLVVVPNFIQYTRSAKLRSSMRQFTTDVRNARQRAVANNSMTKVTFETDVSGGSYTLWESKDNKIFSAADKVWTVYAGPKSLQKPTRLTNTTFDKIGNDTLPGIVFKSTGQAELPAGKNPATVDIKTTDQVPVPKYTISVYPYGKVSAN
jgi:type IV pilus assembly protein PilA